MADNKIRFTDLVTGCLTPDDEGARTLWVPLADELNRDGPDAVQEYLDADRQGLVKRVQDLLMKVRERIDG